VSLLDWCQGRPVTANIEAGGGQFLVILAAGRR
jgi:hypothetical protein